VVAFILAIDNGVFASSSLSIRESMNLNVLEFGSLQSFLLLGILIGKVYS
jgi:hypothetical protein